MTKRIIIAALAVFVAGASLSAQTTTEEFKTRYENQVKRVGYSGLGVETILDRWEAAFPDDVEMLVGKFNCYLEKSMSTEMVRKDQDRFLGEKPVLSLKDSLGADVNWFQETFYDDGLYVQASQAIDKAIKLCPDRLDLRFGKVTSLIAYEKEQPDMAALTLSALIDYNGTAHPVWKYGDGDAGKDDFESGIQDYCAAMYAIGTPSSYASFRSLSEKMLKYSPDSPLFLSNLGTYYFVVLKDNKTATKYYNKVLKLDPGNYTAIKNLVLMARHDKNVKLEVKYLPLLIRYGATDVEKAAAKARLDALNRK